MIRPALFSALALAAATAWARYEADVYGEPAGDSGLPGPEFGWEMVLGIVAYFVTALLAVFLSDSRSPIISRIGKFMGGLVSAIPPLLLAVVILLYLIHA